MLVAALLIVSFYLPGHFLGGMLVGKGSHVVEGILLRFACAVGVGVPVLTGMALAGLFRVHTLVVVLGAIALGIFIALRRFGEVRVQSEWGWWSLACALLMGAALSINLIPAEYVVNSRDPGVYALLAENLSMTGSLIHNDPLVGEVSAFHQFAGDKKYPGVFIMDGQTIVPQFFPGTFVLLGYGSLVAGTWGILYLVPVVSALSVGVTAALGRELFGKWAGICGATLMAMSYTQVWWGRHPSSEILTQFIVMSGLWMSVRFYRERSRRNGIAAGILLGVAMLLRVDAFLAAVVLPVIFIYELFTVRRDAMRWIYPGIPLALFAATALGYLVTFGSRYLDIIYEEHGLAEVLRVAPVISLFAGVIAVAFLLVRGRWGRRVGGYLEVRANGIASTVAVGIFCVALWGYFVLPVPWEELPAASRDFNAYRSQILIRLVWFTTPAVAVLGMVGVLLAVRRMSGGVAIVAGAFLAFGILYTIVPNVAPDLPWATRRFVPATFPILCLLAGFTIVRIGGIVVARRNRYLGIATSALLFAVALGWTIYTVLPILPFRELEGAVGQFDRINDRIPKSEVVYIEMPDGYDVSASTFDYRYGRNVLPYDRLRFIQESDDLEDAGLMDDAVYITTDGGSAPTISGLTFREVGAGRVVAPRLRPDETEIPSQIEELDIEYRIFTLRVM